MRRLWIEFTVNPSFDWSKRTELLPTLEKVLKEAKKHFPGIPLNKLVIDCKESEGRKLPRVILREKPPYTAY